MKELLDNLSEAQEVVLGIVVFILILFLAGWLGERMHAPEDYWECDGPYSHKDDDLPECPSWMIDG